MQVDVRTRHFSLSDAERDRIVEKLEKLERFSPRPPVSARLTLTREGTTIEADLAFLLKSADFRASGQSQDAEAAAEAAIESIRNQLQRHKGRLAGRAKSEEGGLGRVAAEMPLPPVVPVPAGEPVPAPEGFRLRDLTVNEAMDELRRSGRAFHVFRNRQNSRLGVVYLREDGAIGLLEPRED